MKTDEYKAHWGHRALTECSGSENTAPLLLWSMHHRAGLSAALWCQEAPLAVSALSFFLRQRKANTVNHRMLAETETFSIERHQSNIPSFKNPRL